MLRERIITIDLDEGNYRILRYKQYDNNQILKIIIQENKEEVDLAFYTARLFFKLPSGSILEKDTTIENNKIIVSIDSGILSENGRIIADLTLSSSEQLVTAFTMYLDVEETIDRNEAVQSKPEWDLITNTLNNLDTKVDKVEGKSLIANSEIERLSNVDNYDDTELRNLIDTKSDTTHNHNTQYASKSSEHIHDNKNVLDKVTDLKVSEWDNKSDFSGSYEDLTDKPTIPIPDVNKVYVDEQLSNKSDINHTHTELHTHNNKDILDVITQEKINEWNSKSGFSGDYNDLINKPIIPILDGYATENYVKNAIADAQLNGGGGSGSIDLSGYATKDELNAKASVSDIPTKTSQLENDSRFLTSVPSEYVTETELNAKRYLTQHQDISGKVDKVNGKSLISISEIERLANMEDNANNYVHPSTHKASMIVEDNTHRFITDLERVNWNNKVESSQLHEHSNKDVLDGITSDKVANWDKAEENIQSDWNVTDTTSDAYIKNKPSIPSKVSELTNDNLYATETYVQNKIAEAQVGGDIDLSSYALKVDLNEKVDKVSGKGLSTNDYTNEEKNKLSNLSTVATSGNYNDLTNKPSIPTKTSELTNDSSFASESYVTNAINNAQLGGGDGSSVDLSVYQTKSDDTLTTDSKTIVGAINELDTKSIKAISYSTIDTTIGNDVSNRLTELETNKADKTYVDEQISNVSIDLSDYQTKSDNTLTTDVKTITGAINELDTNKTDKTYVDQQISNINTELAEVKQSVSNGKSLIASAITDKGIETLSDATFQTMADNIGLIESGEKSNLPSWCPNFWIEGEPSKVAMGLSSASINNEIYLIGGRDYDSVSASFCTDVNVYNIENNIWSKKTTIPTPRCWLTSDVVNNKIYSIGGYASTGAINTNECYDPLTNTWSSKTSSPWYVYYHTSSVIDNNIYIIGGYWSDSTSDNYCYDTLTDTWSAKTKTSRKRYQSTSNAIGDKIYCMGGYVNDIYDDNICYDTLTNTWSTKSSMLTATYGLVSEVINNKIYCIGGRSSLNPVTLKDAIEVYDVNTDSWKEEGSIKTPRYDFTSEMINDIIYTFCGYTTTSLDITEGYVVAEDIKLGSEEVRSGKELIATAITNKGVVTNNDDTFQTMADNIKSIPSSVRSLPSWCDNGAWIRTIDFEQKVGRADSCVIGNNIYVVGGIADVSASTGNSGQVLCSGYCDYYKTDENRNDFIGSMSVDRHGLGVESVGDYIYAIGGYDDSTYKKTIERTNGVTIDHQWETKAEMPTATAYFGSATVNDKIYCIAGKSPNVQSINMCYDAITDTWSMKTIIPVAKKELTASAVNNCIYCIGGRNDSNDVLSSHHCYDTTTDTWSSKTNIVQGTFGLTSSVIDNCIYCIGGASSIYLNNNKCYDTDTDTWSSKTVLPDNLMYLTSETVDGFIYVIGGLNSSSNYVNTNYCYIPK